MDDVVNINKVSGLMTSVNHNRLAFENSKDGGFRPSLLTLGYVEEEALDVDGLIETVVKLTKKGRERCQGREKSSRLPSSGR